MFPTHVGMNRDPGSQVKVTGDVPHTRGDEPLIEQQLELNKICSPHTWG